MDYYILRVCTGASSFVDAGGGVHIEGYPQLVSVTRERGVAALARRIMRLFGYRDVPERTAGTGCSSYEGEFVVEVPRTVDTSPITGMHSPGPAKMKFHRVDDIDEPEEAKPL